MSLLYWGQRRVKFGKRRRNKKREAIIIWSIIILTCAFYIFFNKTPWHLEDVTQQMDQFLTEKYQRDFAFIEEADFVWLDGKYYALAYPVGNKEVRFRMTYSPSQAPAFIENYPIKLWGHQADKVVDQVCASMYSKKACELDIKIKNPPQGALNGTHGIQGELPNVTNIKVAVGIIGKIKADYARETAGALLQKYSQQFFVIDSISIKYNNKDLKLTHDRYLIK